MDLCPKSSGIQNRVRLNETFSFPYQKEKREKTAASQVLINSLLALCRQLEYTSLLLLREAVAGANMIRYFSFRQRRHIPVVGLKLLALERICQVTV